MLCTSSPAKARPMLSQVYVISLNSSFTMGSQAEKNVLLLSTGWEGWGDPFFLPAEQMAFSSNATGQMKLFKELYHAVRNRLYY